MVHLFFLENKALVEKIGSQLFALTRGKARSVPEIRMGRK